MLKAWNSRIVKAFPYKAEVEYLESTGTQWIQTGVRASKSDLKIEYGVAWTGLYDSNSSNGADYGGGFGKQNQFWTWTSIEPEVGKKYIASFTNLDGKRKGFVDGVYVTNAGDLKCKGYYLCVFAAGTDYLAECLYLCQEKIFYFKAWNNGALVIDFIPVRFKNENGETEGAMYDRVSGRLFRNAGTGAFIIGPDK